MKHPVILMRPEPDLVDSTMKAVRDRVRAAEDKFGQPPVDLTIFEARVLVALMNDMWAGRDQTNMMIDEPTVGMEGTVFGHPFIVVPASTNN